MHAESSDQIPRGCHTKAPAPERVTTKRAFVTASHPRSKPEGGWPMIVQLMDTVAGTPVYVNPAYVVSLRPDPARPTRVTLVKLRDGEALRVVGEHTEVADKLTRAA